MDRKNQPRPVSMILIKLLRRHLSSMADACGSVVFFALLRLNYWLNTEARAVPGLVELA